MKIYSAAWIALAVIGIFKLDSTPLFSESQTDFSAHLAKGSYAWHSKSTDVWNDSIQIHHDTLTVFKNPKNGFGRIFTFTYKYKRLNKEELVLNGLSMKPEGVYVYPEQYSWHLDTVLARSSAGQIIQLIGPDSDEYNLKTTNLKLH